MDSSEIFVAGVVGIAVVFGGGGILISVLSSRQRERVLEELAACLSELGEELGGGELVQAGPGQEPELRFTYERCKVALRFMDHEDTLWTVLTLDLGRLVGFDLSLVKKGFGSGRSLGFSLMADEALSEDMETGDGKFDTNYSVRTRRDSDARDALTDPVRAAILSLRDAAGLNSVAVSSSRKALVVRVQGRLTQRNELAAFLDGALTIFDGFLGTCRPSRERAD